MCTFIEYNSETVHVVNFVAIKYIEFATDLNKIKFNESNLPM